MMSRIRPMQHKRRKLPHQMIRRIPHLDVRTVCDSDEFSVWGEFDVFDGFFEVEVMEDDSATEVDEEGAAV